MRLIAEKLCARRGGRILFAGLSFAVEAGEALLVTGPNGAGKTTLLRTLAGFLPPEAGHVRLEEGAEAGIGEQCHYIGHANAVKPSLTVAENAVFWGTFLGDYAGGSLSSAAQATTSPPPLWGRDRVGGIAEHSTSGVPPPLTPPHKGEGDPDASATRGTPSTAADRLHVALATFGLEALRDIPAGYLSAGQRRRAGLMRLLMARRPIWLLDEPTASLDQAGQEVLAAAVNAHLAGGGQVVAATHLPLAFDRARQLRLGRAAAA